jgi:hypothetical protein
VRATLTDTQTAQGIINAASDLSATPTPTPTATPTPPPAVGGIVELQRDPSARVAHQSDSGVPNYIVLAVAAAAGALALTAGAWCARRRWGR